jgi:hypothetical protein
VSVDEAIDAYLDSHKATLWGRAFALDEPQSRQEAHELIREVVLQVAARLIAYP